jgi:hypothetical protein
MARRLRKKVWDVVASAAGSHARPGNSGASSAHRSRLAVLVDGQSAGLARQSPHLGSTSTGCQASGTRQTARGGRNLLVAGLLRATTSTGIEPTRFALPGVAPRGEAFAAGRRRRLQSFFRTLLGILRGARPLPSPKVIAGAACALQPALDPLGTDPVAADQNSGEDLLLTVDDFDVLIRELSKLPPDHRTDLIPEPSELLSSHATPGSQP